jgi:potassium-transporting ATPase KdpC subunit
MKRDILTSIIGVLLFTALLGIVYPLFITGIGQVAFPGNANGQQVKLHGRLVGSKLIGENFGTPVLERGEVKEVAGAVLTRPDPRYFQSRPSATEGGAYNAAGSTFSNHGPNSVKTEEADAENIKAYIELNTAPDGQPYARGLTAADVPVDAANTSASGLDPEISQANARIQAYRVSAVRHLSGATVNGLIAKYTSGRGLGFSGEPGVNVLELNLALDRLPGQSSGAARAGSRSRGAPRSRGAS